MFEENENLVTDVTENVEQQTTEEIVDETTESDVVEESTSNEETVEEPVVETFTKEQVDEMIAKKLARKEAKIRREYEKKYSRAETVLKAGLQKDNFEEAVTELENYYTQEGVNIPKTQYSQRDTEILANAEANEIIESGYDELVEEVDRLASIGVENMSDRDKIIFNKIAGERKRIEEERELASIGIKKDSLTDEFKEYSKKLNPSLSMKEKYEMYLASKPKKQIETMGSMKSGPVSKVKEHYTEAEINKMTLDDLDDPQVWEAVRKSMTGQG